MKIRFIIHLLLIFCFSQPFLGCMTSMSQLVTEVDYGMDKSEVVEKLGDPYRTDRFRGRDEWVYRFYNEDGKEFQKSVFFVKGRVTKIGKTYNSRHLHRLKTADNMKSFEKAVKEKAKN